MFPEIAEWDTVLRFAELNFIRAEEIASLLSVLVSDINLIPDPLRSEFTQVAASWMDFSADEFFLPSSRQDRIRARAAHLYFRLNEERFSPALQGQLLTGNHFEIQEGLLVSEELGKLSPGMLAMFVTSEIPEIRRTAVRIATRQWMHNDDRDNAQELLEAARGQQPLETEVTMLNSALVADADSLYRNEVLMEVAQSQFLRIRERAVAELDKGRLDEVSVSNLLGD